MTASTDLERRLRQALSKPGYKIKPPLPRRTRLRLWLTRRVDLTACWLVEHDHYQAAIRIWRVSGLWSD